MYKGIEAPTGEYFDIMDKKLVQEKRPFKAVLDVGLIRTTAGNRVFGAMKGAVDGGVFIPHNTKRFPGYHLEKAQATTGKKGKVVEKGKATGVFNAQEHRDHIFGLHVQNYMDLLKKDEKKDKEKGGKSRYEKQFSRWIKTLATNKVANLEALYKKVHSDIRGNPKKVKAERKQAPSRKVISKEKGQLFQQDSKGRKWLRLKKITKEERKARVVAKIQRAITKKSK